MAKIKSAGLPHTDDRLNWHCESPPPKKELKAYTAAPLFTLVAHQLKQLTKPCLHRMTYGELACPYCEAKLRRVFKGYLALFSEQTPTHRYVILLSKTACQALGDPPPWTPVTVFNPGTADHRPVMVARDASRRDTTRAKRLASQRPHDIRAYLLNLWKNKELAAWAGVPFCDQENPLLSSGLTAVGVGEQMASVQPSEVEGDNPAPEVHPDGTPDPTPQPPAARSGPAAQAGHLGEDFLRGVTHDPQSR